MDLLCIDIGSNTVKCSLSRSKKSRITEIFSTTKDLRIFNSTNSSEEIAEKISIAIEDFISQAKEHTSDFSIRAVATSALRESKFKDSIIANVAKKTSVKIEILTGEQEAELSFKGAMQDNFLKKHKNTVFVDLGGGSFEIVFAKNMKVIESYSLPLGAVRMMHKFIKKPKEKVPYSVIEKIIAECNQSLKKIQIPFDDFMCVGAGGSVSAARHMLYGKFTKDNNVIKLEKLESLLKKISDMNLDERCGDFKIKESRADIILPAFACLVSMMQCFGVKKLFHTTSALRAGLIADTLL